MRQKGKTFQDPEQFLHIDEMLPPPPRRVVRQRAEVGGSHSSESQRDLQQKEVEKPSGTHMGGSAICAMSTSAEDGERDVEKNYPALLIGSEEKKTERLLDTEHGEQDCQDPPRSPEKPDHSREEEVDFCPKSAMSARSIVRARRQWALRRARRKEGPNEANQLELGGGIIGSIETSTEPDMQHKRVSNGKTGAVPLLVSYRGHDQAELICCCSIKQTRTRNANRLHVGVLW